MGLVLPFAAGEECKRKFIAEMGLHAYLALKLCCACIVP